MKLLQTTARYYLLYSIIILLIGFLFFYVSLKHVLYDAIDEALLQDKKVIENGLILNQNFVTDKPDNDIYVVRLTKPVKVNDHFSTVTQQKENETFFLRQLESTIKVGPIFYFIRIRIHLEKEHALIDSIVPISIVLLLIILLGILVINNLISRKVWNPFYEVIEKLTSFDVSRGRVIPYTKLKTREFDQLLSAVNKMTNKINLDYISQREFNENFSHELQTPLAIIQNNVELLIQSPRLTEEDMNHLQAIITAIKRLYNLNKGMILLSQIENYQFDKKDHLLVNEVVENLLKSFNYQIEEKKITLQVNHRSDVWIHMDAVLLDVLLSNLISNAIKHNLHQLGFIEITLNEDEIVIENSGDMMRSNPESMFQRFKKQSDKSNSVGLGMSIVKKICDMHQFGISYTSIDSKHIVSVYFKSSSRMFK